MIKHRVSSFFLLDNCLPSGEGEEEEKGTAMGVHSSLIHTLAMCACDCEKMIYAVVVGVDGPCTTGRTDNVGRCSIMYVLHCCQLFALSLVRG